MKDIHTDVVVVGAGLTGLTSAFYLNKSGRDFMVLEQSEQVGGVIQTVQEDGFVYETGPNTGVIGQPEVVELFGDLGNAVELEKASGNVNRRYVLKDGKWHAMPTGLLAGVRTPLFTTKDKFRLLTEPFRQRGKNPEETLEQLVIRRMGESFLRYAVDPFILGIYAGDPARLIPKYALPKLYRLEQEYGSFIFGSVKKKFSRKTPLEKQTTREIFSVRGGLGRLTDALYRAAGPKKFYTGVSGTRVEPVEGGYRIYFSRGGSQESILCKKIISTAGAHLLPSLFPFFPGKDLETLSALPYARVAEVVLGFRKWKGMKLDGFGGLIPFSENRDILGVLFISSFLQERAPEEGALLSVFVGGVRKPGLAGENDEALALLVERELRELMGLQTFRPDLLRIFRYEHAIPQYGAGSGERFRTIERLQNDYPGIVLGGNMRDGIGMADRIRQGALMGKG